jgi:hypothetical protein
MAVDRRYHFVFGERPNHFEGKHVPKVKFIQRILRTTGADRADLADEARLHAIRLTPLLVPGKAWHQKRCEAS